MLRGARLGQPLLVPEKSHERGRGLARSGSASGAFWRSVGVESSCLEWPSAPSPPPAAVLQSVGVQASDETAPKTHPPAP